MVAGKRALVEELEGELRAFEECADITRTEIENTKENLRLKRAEPDSVETLVCVRDLEMELQAFEDYLEAVEMDVENAQVNLREARAELARFSRPVGVVVEGCE